MIKREIQKLMWEEVGIVRNGARLKLALQKIKKLTTLAKSMAINDSHIYNKEWIDALDIGDMLAIAEIIVNSALARKESRGAHHREDFSSQDDKRWLVNLVASKAIRGPEVKKISVPKPIGEVAEVFKL